MAIDKSKWVRGNNLNDADFNFDDGTKKISVKTDAGSSVKAAIDAAISSAVSGIPSETVTTLEVVGDNYVYTNEDATQTVLEPGQFISDDTGQSLTLGTDGRIFVNVIGMLPPDASYSGSNNGNVDISITPDINDPTLFTIEGNLNVAAQTPTNGTNMLKEGASGFYVSTDEINAATADASATQRGLVNLTDGQSLGAGRKDIDGVTIGRGSTTNLNRGTVTAVGTNAAAGNTQGDVTVVGYNAGLNNTGASETALGARAGTFNSGNNSVHVGVYAGNQNAGASHTGTGYAAGQYNTGADAVSAGAYAGAINSGAGATSVGASAGRLNNGADATLIGRTAGYYNLGDNFTAVGANAGSATATSTHSITITSSTGTITPAVSAAHVGRRYQLTVGSQGMYAQFTTTSAFTIVETAGIPAGTYSATLFTGSDFDNSTALGANAQATKSNQVVLGDSNVTEVLTAGNHVADNYIGRVNTSGTIDVSTAEIFTRTVAGATAFSFTGAVSGLVYSFVLQLTNGGSATVTWPTGTKWEGGVAPTLTAAGVDILGFYTLDGGTTWRAALLSKDNK